MKQHSDLILTSDITSTFPGPLDNKMIVNSVADLTDAASWKIYNSRLQMQMSLWYPQMLVIVKSEDATAGVYQFSGTEEYELEDIGKWRKLAFADDIVAPPSADTIKGDWEPDVDGSGITNYPGANNAYRVTGNAAQALGIEIGDIVFINETNTGTTAVLKAANAVLNTDAIQEGAINKYYPPSDREKLDTIEAGAQKNVDPDWDNMQNKPFIPLDIVDLTDVAGRIPADVSQLTDAEGILTSELPNLSSVVGGTITEALNTLKTANTTVKGEWEPIFLGEEPIQNLFHQIVPDPIAGSGNPSVSIQDGGKSLLGISNSPGVDWTNALYFSPAQVSLKFKTTLNSSMGPNTAVSVGHFNSDENRVSEMVAGLNMYSDNKIAVMFVEYDEPNSVIVRTQATAKADVGVDSLDDIYMFILGDDLIVHVNDIEVARATFSNGAPTSTASVTQSKMLCASIGLGDTLEMLEIIPVAMNYPAQFANNAFTIVGNALSPIADDGDIVIGNKAGDGIAKVIGKSDTNFSQAEKDKLAGVADGATNNTGLLADKNSVGTGEIDDEAVTKAKLEIDVQSSLDKADSALQSHQSLEGYATEGYVGNVANTKVDKVAGKGLSDTNFSQAEKDKLAGLESSKYKGQYTSLVDLQNNVSNPAAGDYADVDLGVGSSVVRYIYDADDSEWVEQVGTSTQLTGTQVKQMYEAQPDTNAYTDSEKSKLAGIVLGNAAALNVGTTAGTVAAGDDSRFTNSREWTASTVSQAEAGEGTATTRRAWTAQRVRQAITAWWGTIGTTFGRGLLNSADAASARIAIGAISSSDSITGNAATATKLDTARTISATGDATWTVSFDGTANRTATLTLANSGVTAGTYRSVTVDAKGRVTTGTNPTTIAGYSISDAYTKTQTDSLLSAKANTSSLGTAATKNVGTSSGNVMEVGAFGLGIRYPYTVIDANDLPEQYPYSGFVPVMSKAGSTNVPHDYVYIQQIFYDSSADNLTQVAYAYNRNKIWIRYRYSGGWSDWNVMITAQDLATATGNSSTVPMTQKAVTDALNTKQATLGTNSLGLINKGTATNTYLRNDGTWVTPPNTVYTHPTGAGNNHIPSGGAAGQFLGYSASGVATWQTPPNTTYVVATTSANGLMSSTDKTKLDGIAVNATKNDSDANLKNRANHTGTQAHTTITGLGSAATRDVGTDSGNVMQVGAGGWLGEAVEYFPLPQVRGVEYNRTSVITHRGADDPEDSPRYATTLHLTGRIADNWGRISIGYHPSKKDVTVSGGNMTTDGAGAVKWTEKLIHTGNLPQTTGQTTAYPMSQKATTDALRPTPLIVTTPQALVQNNPHVMYGVETNAATFPENPTAGDKITLIDSNGQWDVTNVTLTAAVDTFFYSNQSTFTLDLKNSNPTFIYISLTRGWQII